MRSVIVCLTLLFAAGCGSSDFVPDAALFMWVRQSAHDGGLDPVLEAAVRDWVEREWPFTWVVYPGRPAPQSPPE